MATCKWCDRSGWLLRISANGLCDACEATEVPVIVRKVQVLRECQDAVESVRTLKSRVERCDDVIGIAEELIPYELKGITVVDPSAAELKSAYEAKRRELVIEDARAEVGKILARAQLLATPRSRISEATKALLEIERARSDYGVHDPVLDESSHLAHRFIQETQLGAHLNEGEREEFKGNRAKALDHYQDALFFLEGKGVDEELRTEHAGRIQDRIRELRQET
jgi:hypothetical protein